MNTGFITPWQKHSARVSCFLPNRAVPPAGTGKHLLHDLLQHRLDINVFQVDAELNMALSHEYELFHLPALFLFVNGEFHCELQAEARLPHLLHALDVALAAPAEEAP